MSHSDTPWVPRTEAEKADVLRQMNRLLETSHFKNSRRYPALFRYIVEQTLAGHGESLKERVLGVEVFGRPAGYDTASDPIVRVTVAEIRKRIAQYYHDEAHDGEMRIELLPGRYEPEFRLGRHPDPHHETDLHAAPLDPPAPPDPAHKPIIPSPVPAAPKRHAAFLLATLGLLLLITAGAVYAWRSAHPSAFDEFWGSVVAINRPIMVCLPVAGGKYGAAATSQIAATTGEIHSIPTPVTSKPAPTTYLGLESLGEDVVFSDVQALANVTSAIAVHHGASRYLLNTAITLDDLRQGPAVLIGALDNQWTLRATAQLRYQFTGNQFENYWIVDSKTGKSTPWTMDLKVPIGSVTRDYAIVARLHDLSTGQIQIVIAGIGMTGTAAASELLTDPALIEQLRQRVGPAFRDGNFEAVVSTDVVNGSAGAPKILTVDVQ